MRKAFARKPIVRNERLTYSAPPTLSQSNAISSFLEKLSSPVATTTAKPPTSTLTTDENCTICLEQLSHSCVRIRACRHSFHDDCIQDCLKRDPKCPVCRKNVGEPQGRCPSGTMHIQFTQQDCSGFAPLTKAIQIDYSMPQGQQFSYHDNPGKKYPATTRTAFLPNNQEGRQLLTRLKYAWMHGLNFTIGTSLTTGQRDSVVWSSIHHKTSLNGGAYGFPDPKYLLNCNDDLTALGVPPADAGADVRNETLHYAAPATLSHSSRIADALEPIGTSSAVPSAPTVASVAPSAPMWFMDDDVICLGVLSGTQACSPIANALGPIGTSSAAPSALVVAGVAPSPPVIDDCAICLDALSGQQACVRIRECKHSFHDKCIQDCLNQEPRCPVCRRSVGEPQGRCPSGTMAIKLTKTNCPGFSTKTIEVQYKIPSGTQFAYHENPGNPYGATVRTAYLPHSKDGCQLLKRLKYAWAHGLTFSIGTSLTTGQCDSVVWSLIQHKTSLEGGPHGFPDPGYLENGNQALDALGVPKADACL